MNTAAAWIMAGLFALIEFQVFLVSKRIDWLEHRVQFIEDGGVRVYPPTNPTKEEEK